MIDMKALVQRAGAELEAAKQRAFSHVSHPTEGVWEEQVSDSTGISHFPTFPTRKQDTLSKNDELPAIDGAASAEGVARRVSSYRWEKWEKWEKPENRAGSAHSRVGNEWERVGNADGVLSLRDERLRRQEPVDFALLPNDLPAPAGEWAAKFSALDPRVDPCANLRSGDWPAIRYMVFDFLARQAASAIELGWSELELFGVHPVVGAARPDCCGALIVLSLAQMPVVSEIEPDLIRGRGGLTFRRRPLGAIDSVPIWAVT
jgi:hypothetical protein